MRPEESARSALKNIVNATSGERAIILCDDVQRGIGDIFARGALDLGLWTKLVTFETSDEVRGSVEEGLKELIVLSKPDVCVNIFRQRDEETSFRGSFVRFERSLGARIGHCPGITEDMLTEGALALTDDDYRDMFAFGERLKHRLKGAELIHVTSPHGADFTLSTKDREFAIEKTNLPCGEVMCIPPVGNSFQGTLVCTSGGANRIYRDTPVKIDSRDGLAGEIVCDDPGVLGRIEAELDRDEGARYLGEFAFGINPKARLIDQFLEAEKVIGTIHVAFGGSEYPSKTHLDMLVEKPDVEITDKEGTSFLVMEQGRFMI